jgi:hypothetical protein
MVKWKGNQGTRTVSFSRHVDHDCFAQVTASGTILYLDGFGVHVELLAASKTQWDEYLTAGGEMIGVRFEIETTWKTFPQRPINPVPLSPPPITGSQDPTSSDGGSRTWIV